MSKIIEDILGPTEEKDQQLVMVITQLKVLHPGHRYHLMAHIKDKLQDPNHMGCELSIHMFLETIFRVFSVDQINMLLEEIDPPDAELKAYGILDQVNEFKKQGKIH